MAAVTRLLTALKWGADAGVILRLELGAKGCQDTGHPPHFSVTSLSLNSDKAQQKVSQSVRIYQKFHQFNFFLTLSTWSLSLQPASSAATIPYPLGPLTGDRVGILVPWPGRGYPHIELFFSYFEPILPLSAPAST